MITFPDAVLADAERYRRAAVLPAGEATTASDDEAVRVRRDLAVEGWAALVEGGPGALDQLHRRAVERVGSEVEGWRARVADGPRAAVDATLAQLDALAQGRADHLTDLGVWSLPPVPQERRYGCCGTLGVAVWP